MIDHTKRTDCQSTFCGKNTGVLVYLEAVAGEGTLRVDGLVHVGEQQREEDDEPKHGKHRAKQHLKGSETQQTSDSCRVPDPYAFSIDPGDPYSA